ncbi:MAG TPA: ribosomal protein L16 [Thermoplasmata archaeon]|nr:ribosomal protein L16 [Thermoplasmata archaeon]
MPDPTSWRWRGTHTGPRSACTPSALSGAQDRRGRQGPTESRMDAGAFGSPLGTAARVEPGTKVLTILTTEANVAHAREAMRKAGSKLPMPWHLVVERGEKK